MLELQALNLSARLRPLLAERGLSQADVARRMHAKSYEVFRWCKGTRPVSAARLGPLADAIGVTYTELTGLELPRVPAEPEPCAAFVPRVRLERFESYGFNSPWGFPSPVPGRPRAHD